MTLVASATVPVWLIGAGGMMSGELLRLLERHPSLRLQSAVVRREARSVSTMHPHLPIAQQAAHLNESLDQLVEFLSTADHEAAVFLGLPHGESAAVFAQLEHRLARQPGKAYVVDMAADFRLRELARYEATYGCKHACPQWLEHFVYGLPEWHREALRQTRFAAAPGCFATALQLATLPIAGAQALDPKQAWVFHAITGSSGSGIHPKAGTHHPHRHGNLWAYGLHGHRHEAELRQALTDLELEPQQLQFLPHSGPFARGIHLTAVLPLSSPASTEAVREIYDERYTDCPFVEVLQEGVPDLRRVAGSNRACLTVHVREQLLTVLLTLDNLVKGGAGQAVQCMNLMLGRPEQEGLPTFGMGVC